jgi:DNA-binding NarL/FixJ family response regulator
MGQGAPGSAAPSRRRQVSDKGVNAFPQFPTRHIIATSSYGSATGHADQRPKALTPVVRILIADAYEVVCIGLQETIQSQSWEIVAVAYDGNEAIKQALVTRPHVAIVGYALPLVNGIEVARRIRARLPKTEVLIFTKQENEAVVAQALEAGARGYLLKSDANRELIAAIEALVAHKPFFTAKVSESLLRSFATRSGHKELALTPRERQIVQLIAEGYSSKAIARLLNISLKTVDTHRSAIMHKLNLSSPAALVRYAVRNKIVEP